MWDWKLVFFLGCLYFANSFYSNITGLNSTLQQEKTIQDIRRTILILLSSSLYLMFMFLFLWEVQGCNRENTDWRNQQPRRQITQKATPKSTNLVTFLSWIKGYLSHSIARSHKKLLNCGSNWLRTVSSVYNFVLILRVIQVWNLESDLRITSNGNSVSLKTPTAQHSHW